MATIQGKVIQVKLNTTIPYAPQSGKAGGYQGYKITYENDQGETKEIAKAMASLKYTPAIRSVLEDLKPGDDFTIVQEKVGNFLEVKALTKGRDENAAFTAAVDSAAPAVPASRSYTPARNTSTYETPEERKVKQRLIVRQAALNQALEFHNLMERATEDVDDVKETAQVFEKWVYRGIE